MQKIDHYKLAEFLIGTAQHAGQVQLDIYHSDFQVDYKQDDSPVSQADILSEKVILEGLAKIAPNIPVLAEEAVSMGNIPDLGDQFFCVDPLDGTKEFVKKNNEFTVNIALIEKGIPVFGLVYVPVTGQLFVTLGKGWAVSCIVQTGDSTFELDKAVLMDLKARTVPESGFSVVVSRSHMNEATESFLEGFEVIERISAGSSLKFCLVASGRADLYPRFTPTNAWDTAAGHAIVLAAGGTVLTSDGSSLHYDDLAMRRIPYLNPSFVVMGGRLS